MKIRPARGRDARAIHQVVRAVFGQAEEADLIERLRRDGDIMVELVAEHEKYLVGHICFSPLGLSPEPADAPVLAALAPVTVWPEAQRQGIGRELVQAGLHACRAADRETAMRVLVKGVCIATIAFSIAACGDAANDNVQSANDDGTGAMETRAVTGGSATQGTDTPGATGAPLPDDGAE